MRLRKNDGKYLSHCHLKNFMEKKQSKIFTKLNLFIALSIFWIIGLVFFTTRQNQSFNIKENSTLTPFVRIAKNALGTEPITPLYEPEGFDFQKVTLGRKLFFDPIMSHDNTLSCASCHDLEHGGADNLPRPVGINQMLGERNTPTVLNSGFNFRQFWDGRALTLEDQINGPTHNSKEMGSSWNEILDKLNHSPEYAGQFEKIYHVKEITADLVREVISTFERELVTTNSPFDRWLKGDKNALTIQQKEGYKLFKTYGCVSCHHGVNVGGNMFERLGIFLNFYETHPESAKDLGRFNITNQTHTHTRNEFKVPSLRNIALTSPYLHDGSVKTLREMINIMALYQLGETLPDSEIMAIEAFLNSLTGQKPAVLK